MARGRPGVPSWVDATGGQSSRTSPQAPLGDDWERAGPVGGSSRLQASLSRGLAYLLWGVLVLALVLGLVNFTALAGRAGSTGTVADPTEPALVPPPGGCAELVVAGWLSGDTELLSGVAGLSRGRVEPGRRRAGHIYTAAATPGHGAWGYLIGAEVELRDDDNRWRPAGLRFFTVTMVPTSDGTGCQGWGPVALPAEVPAPQLGGGAVPGYEVSLPTAGTELSQTLTSFFSGLLAGTENVERYVAPGVFIPTLVPPPYQQAEVTDLRARTELPETVPPDGTVAQLLVTVTTDQADLPLVYPVTVGVRGGRWEVIALDPLVGTEPLSVAGPADRPDDRESPATAAGSTDSADRTNGGQ